MVTITCVNVSATCDTEALRLVKQRKMFRNPRGLQRYYVFYRKDVGGIDNIRYAWNDNLTTAWNVVDTQAMTTANLKNPAVAFVEDAANFQTIVYVAAEDAGNSGEVRIRRGTIADAASVIVWNAEEQLFDNTHTAGRFDIAIDPNFYLWANTLHGAAPPYSIVTKASQVIRPPAPIAWGATLTVQNWVNVQSHFGLTPYTAAWGIVGIGHQAGYPSAWAASWAGGVGAPALQTGPTLSTYLGSIMSCGPGTTDNVNIVHVSFGYSSSNAAAKTYCHQPYNPATDSWGTRTTIYDGQDNTYDAPLLVCDTSRTPNYLYAIYEHGTGEVEYKTTPIDAIAWSGATQIENHAEDIRYTIGWYTDDTVGGGWIYGAYLTGTTDTVRSFIIVPGPPAGTVVSDVKPAGWWKGKRAKKLFIDGDRFIGQDLRRWENYQISTGLPDDTGFAWSVNGRVSIPADHEMRSANVADNHTYAYVILTAVVESADMSDCSIGFYAGANHYCWIDQDFLRARNGLDPEETVDISGALANNNRLKLILIWTPLMVRLIVSNIDTGVRNVYQLNNPPQVQSYVTFQVIAGGSPLLVHDYVLLDAENDLFYSWEILHYVTGDDGLAVAGAVLDAMEAYLEDLADALLSHMRDAGTTMDTGDGVFVDSLFATRQPILYTTDLTTSDCIPGYWSCGPGVDWTTSAYYVIIPAGGWIISAAETHRYGAFSAHVYSTNWLNALVGWSNDRAPEEYAYKRPGFWEFTSRSDNGGVLTSQLYPHPNDSEWYHVICTWTPRYVMLEIFNFQGRLIYRSPKHRNTPQARMKMWFQQNTAGTMWVSDVTYYALQPDHLEEKEPTLRRDIYV